MQPTQRIGSGLLVFALLGAGGTVWWLSQRKQQAAAAGPPVYEQTPGNSANSAAAGGDDGVALQEEVNRLEAEHTRLMSELAAINKENAGLEKQQERAERAARLFKELASQSNATNQDATNTYPTARHVLAGVGKQARLMAEMEAKWGDVEENKLPPEEQRAMGEAMLVIASEMMRLRQVAAQINGGEKEDFPQPSTAEGRADYSSCYLYGALGLDSRQFSTINGILQRYFDQAAQENLLQAAPGESAEAATNRIGALNELDERARAEIQPLLTPEQVDLLSRSALKQLKFVATRFYPPGFGFAFGGPTGK